MLYNILILFSYFCWKHLGHEGSSSPDSPCSALRGHWPLSQQCCSRAGLQLPTALPCQALGPAELGSPVGLCPSLGRWAVSQSHLRISVIPPWPRVSGLVSNFPYGDCSCCSLLSCLPLPATAPCLSCIRRPAKSMPLLCIFTPSYWSAPALADLAAVFSPNFPTLTPKQNHTVHTAFSLSHPCTVLWTLQRILYSFYSIQTEES